MQSAINGLLALGTGVGLVLGFLPGTAAAGPVDDALAAARQDVEQGRCEQAAARVRGIDGLESRAGLLAGQCQIQAGLYPEALTNLDRVRGSRDLSGQQIGDVELYRGVALYHLERYAEAAAALESARGLTSEEAQLQLYTGLLLLRDGDNDRAAPALEAASRLEPRLTEPVASYYAGLAWQGAAERQRARDAFQRVVDLDGDGPWGKEAKKLLESTELFPYFVRGRFGIEYDDNVLLRGDVTQIVDGNPLTIAGESDWRGVWQLDGGVQVWQSADAEWTAGVTGSYAGNAHYELADINTHYPTIGGFLANRVGPTTMAQARYQFGHAWVNEDPYLQSHFAELSLSHTWTRAGTTLVVADIVANDLRFEPAEVTDNTPPPLSACPVLLPGEIGCSPPGVNENRERERDGIGYGAAVEHRALLPVPAVIDSIFEAITLGGGYRFRFYDSEGEEWEHHAHIFSAGAEVELPLDSRIFARASYEYRGFLNPSTFPDSETPGVEYTLSNSDRREHEFIFEGEAEKDITDNWSVSARYQFLTNDSNRDAYNYDRHIVGGYINFRFD